MLAVSGGMDSMAMAELFHRADYNFAIAHCNFKLRAAESDEDERFVKEAAKRFGVQCYTRTFDTAAIANTRGISTQMAARDLRYAFFEEVASEYLFDHIATAHHLDDQTETFFINLARGCGIGGLHGIKLRHGKIIRPLMYTHRVDIEDFVRSNGIAYRTDSSNQSTHYQRNKIRHQLIPILREINPGFDAEMAANISRLRDTEKIFRAYIEMARSEAMEHIDDVAYLDIKKLMELDPLPAFLYEFLSPYGFKSDDAENIIAAMGAGSGKTFYSLTHQLLIDRKKIIISGLPDDRPEQSYQIGSEDKTLEEPLKLSASVHKKKEFSISAAENMASLDLAKLKFPLTLRRWKKGDSFIPLGMHNRKKLSDFFIDEKYSLLDKQQAWLLCSGDDIAWIVGKRIDDRFKITPETELVYLLKLL